MFVLKDLPSHEVLNDFAKEFHNLDIDKLYVSEATVGKALVMKRLDVRGRSKAGRITKPFSHLRIVVSEIGEVA